MQILLLDFNPFAEPVTPISLGYLGAVLRRAGHAVTVLSLGSTTRFSPRSLAGYLAELRPALVGFGAYQRNLYHLRALARVVKASVGAKVAIGGPQATFLPDAALAEMPEIDFVGRGEGEQTILAMVAAIESDALDRPIPGVTSRIDGQVVTGPAEPAAADLDDYPSPWLSGVLDPAELPESILLGSRGCPFGCAFCYTPAAFSRKIRYHSVDRVVEEIAWIARRGSGRLWFADPNFSLRAERVVELLEAILGRDLAVEMWVETRADMIDDRLLALMKRAGVHTVAMGLESASPQVTPGLNKRLELDEIRAAVGRIFAHDIDVELFSQFALPGEGPNQALATLEFVKACGVAIRGNSNAQQMQLYYGTEICARPADYGVIPLRDQFPPGHSIGAAFETRWMKTAEIDRVKAAWRASSLDGGKRLVS